MDKNSLKKLVIACGGTGGHFYPGLSIARECKTQNIEVTLFLSGKHSIRQAEIAKSYNIDSILIPSSPRSRSPKGIYNFLKDLLIGTLRARKHFSRLDPDAFLAMGSFASIPSGLAARSKRVPLFLHEGNARIGRANAVLSRFSRLLMTAFPSVNPEISHAKIVETGMPVRPELLGTKRSKSDAIAELNNKFNCSFDHSKMTLLVFGGSQGTQIFNETLPPSIARHGEGLLQVIHLTGKNKLNGVKELYSNEQKNVLLQESTPEMDLMLSAADAVICRSGGSTLAELMIFGKYPILVPYPWAADGHQHDNALHLTVKGSAKLVTNDEFSAAFCDQFVLDIIANQRQFDTAGKKNEMLAKPLAAQKILGLIDENIQ